MQPGISDTGTQPPWPVKNAGLVLVSSYIQLLFTRLGIISHLGKVDEKEDAFLSDAVHYLKYVVTGHCATVEHWLLLNKLLCGLPLQHPVHSEILMPEAHKTLIEQIYRPSLATGLP